MSPFRTAQVFASMVRAENQHKQNNLTAKTTAESLLNSVLSHSSLILWALDADGVFTISRGSGLRELGLSDNQVVGQSAFEIYKDHPEILNSVKSGLRGIEHHDIVEVNGAVFQTWFSPIRGESGEILGLVGISSAVTELETYRQAAYTSELHFHLAFQKSPVMMAILKAKTGEIIDANEAFEKITGFEGKEVFGRTSDEIGLWKSYELIPRDGEDWKSFNSFHDRKIKARSRSGQELNLVASAARLEFQGQVCLLVFARDATKETVTARELQKSEKRFTTLAKQAPVGIFQCTQAGEIVYANDCFWSGVGQFDRKVEQDGPCKTCWFNLFQSNSQSLRTDWENAVEQNVSFRRELQVSNDDGEMEWGLLQIDEFSEEEGQFIGSLSDITAMKRAESASILQRRELEKAVRQRTKDLERLTSELLKEIDQKNSIAQELKLSQEQMQAVVNNAVDFILRLDKQARIEYINHVAEGLTQEQVLGTHALDWVRGEYRDGLEKQLIGLLQYGEEISFEAPLHYPNGVIAICAMKGGPILLDGEIVGASIVCRDITRERELEAEARQRLEVLSHMARLSTVGEMSATMSHELKQPLMAISNYASGCLTRLEDGTYEPLQVVTHLQTIMRMSEKGLQILRRTREFVSNRPFDPKPTAIDQVVESSLEFVQPDARANGVDIVVECEPEIPECRIDSIQIQQVIVNVLMNALDAIKESKKAIKHRITMRAFPCNGDSITLLIQDTADGIDEGFIESMFDAFQTSKQNGLGMGLAISRGIVENHGGTLKVKYTGPEGTIFQLRLPSC